MNPSIPLDLSMNLARFHMDAGLDTFSKVVILLSFSNFSERPKNKKPRRRAGLNYCAVEGGVEPPRGS